MGVLGVLEMLTYLVTILGLPAAIAVFFYEQRKQRQNEENALHRTLSEEYDNFMRLVLANSDLLLISSPERAPELTDEQKERRYILFGILISVFEKAYIILYSDSMTGDTARLWASWEDDMHDWCGRADFRAELPRLLEGEDQAFERHIRAIAGRAAGAVAQG